MKLNKLTKSFLRALLTVLLICGVLGAVVGAAIFAAHYLKTFFTICGVGLFAMTWYDAYARESDA